MKSARAIEWVELEYLKKPFLTKPKDMSLIVHDIMHFISGYDTSWTSEIKLTLPFPAALDVAAGDDPAAKKKAFLVSYAKKSNGVFFRPDGSICSHTDKDYNDLGLLSCRRNKNFQHQAASLCFDRCVEQFLPLAKNIVGLFDGRKPDYIDMFNLRLTVNDEGKVVSIRRPTAQEAKLDELSPVRDVLTGTMLDENGQALPLCVRHTTITPKKGPAPEAYQKAAWFASQFPELSRMIAEPLSSIVVPMEQEIGACTIDEWRNGRCNRLLAPAQDRRKH